MFCYCRSTLLTLNDLQFFNLRSESACRTCYYYEHFYKDNTVVISSDATEAQCIWECQKLLQDVSLAIDLSSIANTFLLLSKTITKLETNWISLSTPIELVEEVEKTLQRYTTLNLAKAK